MKKKLGIALAIIHDPELIFLDELTSGLDAESLLHIHQLIDNLHKRGKTIFMTSHNLDEVEKICTKIAIMKEDLPKDGIIDKKIRGESIMNELFPALLTLLPLFILAFVLRWVRQIKENTEIQVEQNKEIIALLQKIDKKNE